MKNTHLIGYAQVIALVLGWYWSPAHAIDNPHFWRATPFLPPYYEPRIAKSGLTSFDAFIFGGSTRHSRNRDGDKTSLLNMYGPHNMQALATGLVPKDLNSPEDIALTMLSLAPCRCNFGQLQFDGKFKTVEGSFFYTQNIGCGIFFQVHVPVRRLEIKDICFCDQTPDDCIEPNKNSPSWQTFLNLFPNILNKYALSLCSIKKTGVGDTSVLIGWTYNYEETDEIDYFDFTIRTGILIPTGKKKNQNLAFDLPTGYNGHTAVPFSFDCAMGSYDWLTMGIHGSATVFTKRTQCVRMQTDGIECEGNTPPGIINGQQGFIKLLESTARIELGTLWQACVYLKADHVVKGISFWAAYIYSHKNNDWLVPCELNIFNSCIVSSDQAFKAWKMHSITFMAEYDFTTTASSIGPRIGVFYTKQMSGQRVFDTSVGGGSVGFDIGCDF